jgi:hypothetical protein
MTSTSAHQKFSGLLIVIGSLVFVCGGAFHPKINSSLGALGSSEFFQNFYMHIAHHDSWRLIHGMILTGPLMWLLGASSFWSDRSGWTRMASSAMTLAATVWAVTFVFDGFVAPDIVRWMTPETGLYQLAVNQDAVIRLGLVSWLMLGFSIIAGSMGILVRAPLGVRGCWRRSGSCSECGRSSPGRQGCSFPAPSPAGIGMQPPSARPFGSLLWESFYWFLWRHRAPWSPRASDRAWITAHSETIHLAELIGQN